MHGQNHIKFGYCFTLFNTDGYKQEPCEISSFGRSGDAFMGLPGIWRNVNSYFRTTCTETTVSNRLLTMYNISVDL